MAQYQQLNDDIICIDTEQQRPGLAASYLIGHAGRYAFIDTGTSLSAPSLLQVLDDQGIGRGQVDYVMPTHVHLDHAGGAGALMQALPNARLVIHPRGARHMINPTQLIAGATAVYGSEGVRRMYGEIVPVPEVRVVVAEVGEGREVTFDLGGRSLRLIDVPGHARHHYAIWDALSRGWFTGDSFGVSYREFDWDGRHYLIPTTTPVQFDPQAWLQTLKRLLAESPQYMYLTHYGRIGNVEAMAQALRDSLGAYQRIAHEQADTPDRHTRLTAALMRYHLDELSHLDHPMPEIRARQLLAFDTELNAQGLEVWLARQQKTGAST